MGRDALDAAMHAPAAVNEQAWQFVVLAGKTLDDCLKIHANIPKGDPVGCTAGSMPGTGSRFNETKVHRQAWGGR